MEVNITAVPWVFAIGPVSVKLWLLTNAKPRQFSKLLTIGYIEAFYKYNFTSHTKPVNT